MSTRIHLPLFLALSLSAACSIDEEPDSYDRADPDVPDHSTEDTTLELAEGEDWVDADLLAEVEIEEAHTLEFYEFEPGELAVIETFNADLSESVLPPPNEVEELNVLDTWIAVTDADIPDPLFEAQDRLLVREAELSTQAVLDPEPASADPDAASATELNASVPQATPEASCAPDYYNDNYGASWFMGNYCNAGAFQNCQTNWAGFNTYRFTSTWFRFNVMAADFQTSARMWGGTSVPHTACSPFIGCDTFYFDHPQYDLYIGPRQVKAVQYYSTGVRYGHGAGNLPCRRIHAAELSYRP